MVHYISSPEQNHDEKNPITYEVQHKQGKLNSDMHG